MIITSGNSTKLAVPRNIPRSEYQAILERQKESELKELQRRAEQLKKVQQIRQNHEDQLRKMIGVRKLERYRAFIAGLRQGKADILLPPGNAREALEKWQKIHLQHKRKAAAFLQEAGIDQQKIKEVNAAAGALHRELLPATPVHNGRPVTLLLPEEVSFADEDPPNDPNATILRPPYLLEFTDNDQFVTDNFSYTPTFALNASTGLVGGSSILKDPDAGDFDVANSFFETMVAFFYQMPATGLLEVWIEAQSALSKHRLHLFDEFGFSGANAHQVNFLAMKAVSASQTSETRYCEMSRFDVDDETDGFWNITPLTDGNTYWAHLFSSVPFEEGRFLLVQVGSRIFHSSIANDVEVDSTIEFNWFLRSIRLNSTGTPSGVLRTDISNREAALSNGG